MSEKRFGDPVLDWVAPPFPRETVLSGHYARLERLEERHAHELYMAYAEDNSIWDYLGYGPFSSEVGFLRWVRDTTLRQDPWFYTMIDTATGLPGGVLAYLRIAPQIGTIELGHINIAPRLQRSRVATEAMVMMIGWAFEAGYRRFEWKCDTHNIPSRQAAQRLGFSYEGTFRQATIVKGRNRDTAWFAATDKDWPGLAAAYEAWLDPGNFDPDGQQHEHLSDLTRLVRVASDPVLGREA